jgi:hypothetical protein
MGQDVAEMLQRYCRDTAKILALFLAYRKNVEN